MLRILRLVTIIALVLSLPLAAAMAANSGGGSSGGGSSGGGSPGGGSSGGSSGGDSGGDGGSQGAGTNSSGGTSVDIPTALAEASALVDAGNYAAAKPILEAILAQQSGNADAHNLLGYSHRETGNTDLALHHYKRALQISPKHLGANEYLGELYLKLGDLEKAEQRLAVLAGACQDCEEYVELKELIDAYKAQQG
jgi:thioredoxin-like negative regulator of GroEL